MAKERENFFERIRPHAEWETIRWVWTLVLPGVFWALQRIRNVHVDWIGVGILFGLCVVVAILLFSSKRSVAKVAEGPVQDFRLLKHEEQQPVIGKTFLNEIVNVDGKAFTDCNFSGVQLRFEGKASFSITHSNFEKINVTTSDPRIWGAWALAKATGMMPQSNLLDHERKPVQNVKNPTRSK